MNLMLNLNQSPSQKHLLFLSLFFAILNEPVLLQVTGMNSFVTFVRCEEIETHLDDMNRLTHGILSIP